MQARMHTDAHAHTHHTHTLTHTLTHTHTHTIQTHNRHTRLGSDVGGGTTLGHDVSVEEPREPKVCDHTPPRPIRLQTMGMSGSAAVKTSRIVIAVYWYRYDRVHSVTVPSKFNA